MYSITREGRSRAYRFLLRGVAHNPYVEADKCVRFGARFKDFPAAPEHKPVADPARHILFMAGMHEPTRERLEHVLDVRGLRLILGVGDELSRRGYSLTVAISLLADETLRRALMTLPDNRWPSDRVAYHAEVRVPEIYREVGVFVFPYAREEVQFVPTSVIEAMFYGVPVVLPQLAFLRPLHDRADRCAWSYRAGDSAAFMAVLDAVFEDDGRRNAAILASKRLVHAEFDIKNTVQDILRLYGDREHPASLKT